ncbi:MAG: ExeA family protein, partial [Puniceicoccales bacterium]
MYQEFFGLSEMPFNVTPDPKFLYLSPTHQDALAHLRYGIKEKKGFIVLTGEVGCGKTTLCRTLLDELDEQPQVETVLILNPRISEQQLLFNILHELGEEVPESSNLDLTARLNGALLKRIHAGKEIVMIIDEAQNLSFEVMVEIVIHEVVSPDALDPDFLPKLRTKSDYKNRTQNEKTIHLYTHVKRI